MLLEARHLTKTYAGVTALADVSLDLRQGETLGVVGPSGSGKSTLARTIARLLKPDSGAISFAGQDWLGLQGRDLRRARAGIQMVFQDPGASFHPQAVVGDAIADALRLHRIAPRSDWPDETARLLDQVGLPADFAIRRVAELSGGQRQRVAIARAIATKPKLVILDEAVSALDASVRARILDLLVRIQKESAVSYLFVSHDLAVVRMIAHRTAVMDQGRIIETGPTGQLIATPQTAITRDLIAAIPKLHPERVPS